MRKRNIFEDLFLLQESRLITLKDKCENGEITPEEHIKKIIEEGNLENTRKVIDEWVKNRD